MNTLALIVLSNFITSIVLGLFVLAKEHSSKINKSYFVFNLTIALYSGGYFLWQITPDPARAIFWFKILFIGVILVNFAFVWFVINLTETIKKIGILVLTLCGINSVYIYLNVQGTMFDGFHLIPNLGIWPIPNRLFDLYVVFWHIECLYAFYLLIMGIRSHAGLKQLQIKYVALACLCGYLGGVTNWPVFYGFRVSPYPTIAISLYVGIIAFAIVRFRLMDFGLLFRWGIALTISVIIIASFFLAMAFLVEIVSHSSSSLGRGIPTLLMVCAMVFMFDPIKKRTVNFVDRFIFKSPDYQSILDSVEKIFNEQSFSIVYEELARKLKDILGVQHAGVVLWNYQNAHFSVFPKSAFVEQTITRKKRTIDKADFLVRTLESERRLFWNGVVSEEELIRLGNTSNAGEKMTIWKMRRTMLWLGASLCVPMMHEDSLIGFLILGPKRDQTLYTKEDKKFLCHISQMISSPLRDFVFGKSLSMLNEA